jgi:hypothetical protein
MLNGILEWAVVFLPTILSVVGVLVSLRAPKSEHHRRWLAALVMAGVAISILTSWQQSRARSAHSKEVDDLKYALSEIKKNTQQPPRVEVHIPPMQPPVVNIPQAKPPVVVVNPQGKAQRILTPEQHDRLVAILKQADPTSTTVLHAQGDFEAQTYADFFIAAFKGGGCKLLESGFMIETRQGEGLKIMVRSIKTAPPAAVFLQNALKQIGLNVDGAEAPQVPEGHFWLYVGVQK